jgi:hypothetical protein
MRTKKPGFSGGSQREQPENPGFFGNATCYLTFTSSTSKRSTELAGMEPWLREP